MGGGWGIAGSNLLRTAKESLKWLPEDSSKRKLRFTSYFLVQITFSQESCEVAISIFILLMRKNVERSGICPRLKIWASD